MKFNYFTIKNLLILLIVAIGFRDQVRQLAEKIGPVGIRIGTRIIRLKIFDCVL